jgi:tRNA A-37 threonylcarbamoyl transferase component Bud32
MLVGGSVVGRYVVRRKLAEGGMAEIYLATVSGAEGFSKEVALKVVRPHLANDPQFVQMFVAEAQLVSKLNHVNLVQIFDFGRHEQTYYLAMEYVRGASLWELRHRCHELGLEVPPLLAADLCAQVARGLHIAHTLTDQGRPLGVVHRDVSPHNVLLSLDGAVKLIDFGIAKAGGPMTEPGVLKGKLAYMSPEQVRGETLDARSDLFALGVVLWELLTGARLFDFESDTAMMQAVMRGTIPVPTRLNPDVPEALSEIVMKALVRDREGRFQSGAEFDRALSTFVRRSTHSADELALAPLMQQLFGDHAVAAAASEPSAAFGVRDTLLLERHAKQVTEEPTLTATPVQRTPLREAAVRAEPAEQPTATATPVKRLPPRATPLPVKESLVPALEREEEGPLEKRVERAPNVTRTVLVVGVVFAAALLTGAAVWFGQDDAPNASRLVEQRVSQAREAVARFDWDEATALLEGTKVGRSVAPSAQMLLNQMKSERGNFNALKEAKRLLAIEDLDGAQPWLDAAQDTRLLREQYLALHAQLEAKRGAQ